MDALNCDSMRIADSLADFAASLEPDAIPEEVRLRARYHLLDAVGIALASGKRDFAQRTLLAMQRIGGHGDNAVLGLSARLAPRDAAILNGLLCHGLDFDDTHLGAVVHPTASAFPTALAAAELAGANLDQIVTAYILGVEVAARLGKVASSQFHASGFHPTGVVGAFSSALVAGKLLDLTAEELRQAQGIALSFASGSLEFLEDGAWTKRIHPGWAAAAGLQAAALASTGFVGANAPYEGRFGLYRSYLGDRFDACDLGEATRGLGTIWELLETAIKPYPACHFTHGSIDAALALGEKINGETITRITARVPREVMPVVCEPEENKKRPANSYDAQFSIPFLVAAAIRRGQLSLAEIEGDALKDQTILQLADIVVSEPDPDSPYPKAYSGEVVVELANGETLSHREEINRGASGRPLSNGEIADKFRQNATASVSARRAAEIEALVLEAPGSLPAQMFAATLGTDRQSVVRSS